MIQRFSDAIDTSTIIAYTQNVSPIISAMCEALQIPQNIDNELGYLNKNMKITLGVVVKALIINTLTCRTPLMHVEDSFKDLDCEVLFGEGVTSELFNDDRLGRCLGLLGNSDINKLFSKICMKAIEQHKIVVTSAHVDTTNISVYGEYKENQEAKENKFEVVYGDPKSKRKDLKQFNIGLFVDQTGVPLGGNALSGNTSDALWFREALDELDQMFTGDLSNRPCFIFDAAGSNKTMFEKADTLKMPSIIRLSDSFSISEKYTMKTWEENSWSDVINVNEDKENKKKVSEYRLCEYEVALTDKNWRLIVIHSYELEKVKEASYSRNIVKNELKLTKLIEKLGKDKFDTIDEANEILNAFKEKNIKLLSWYKTTSNIKENIVKAYETPGRPPKGAKKVTKITYKIDIEIIGKDEEVYENWLKKESCFILVSNVLKERYNTYEIFKEYKEQWVVENKFKFMKQPSVMDGVWLENEDRIKGLTFILLLSALVSTYMCYRLAKTLENNRTNKSGPGRILTTDGRLLTKASFEVIKKILKHITVIATTNEKGEVIRKFQNGTEIKLLEAIEMIGFNFEICIKPYEIGMDIWNKN